MRLFYSWKQFTKLLEKLSIIFPLVRWFHVLALFLFSRDCIKVSHRLQSQTKKRKERMDIRIEASETRTKNILPYKNFFSRNEIKSKKLISTCTNAVCPSRVTTKADTKSVGVISIDLFHRKSKRLVFEIRDKFHYGKLKFSLVFLSFSGTFTWFQSNPCKARHFFSLSCLWFTVFHNQLRKINFNLNIHSRRDKNDLNSMKGFHRMRKKSQRENEMWCERAGEMMQTFASTFLSGSVHAVNERKCFPMEIQKNQ